MAKSKKQPRTYVKLALRLILNDLNIPALPVMLRLRIGKFF